MENVMKTIREGEFSFRFPSERPVVKFDDSKFYRNRISKCHATKAVDFIAWSGSELFIKEG